MKVILIGRNGQLGSDLYSELQRRNNDVVGLTHADLEVTDAEQVFSRIDATRPDIVVNTAAFHKVEECEKSPGPAFEVNGTGVWNLARACERIGAVLMHFSTDYVFPGTGRTPYEVTDLPAPINVYGASKVAGEHLVAYSTDRYFLVRTCGLYGIAGSSGKGGNFVELMLRKAAEPNLLKVVNDQVLTPTFTAELAKAAVQLIETGAFGLYHLTCEGECSWYEFAHRIFEIEGLSPDLMPVATSAFPSPVKRPAYSVLSKTRATSVGVRMPVWQEALERYLRLRAQVKMTAHSR